MGLRLLTELDPSRLGRLEVGLHLRLGGVELVAVHLGGVADFGLELALHQVVDDRLLVCRTESARRTEIVEAVDEADRGQSGHEQPVAGRRGAGRLGGPGGCQVRLEVRHPLGERGVVLVELFDFPLCERPAELGDFQLALEEILDGVGEAHLTVAREHALGVADLVFPPPQSR